MTRPSTEAEGIESAIPRSKGGIAIHCEIARTCDSSVPRPTRSHEQTSHLTTGTFNLLSKTESAFRLSGASQSNSRHKKHRSSSKFCRLHSLFRRVETNLSKVPQLFSMC